MISIAWQHRAILRRVGRGTRSVGGRDGVGDVALRRQGRKRFGRRHMRGFARVRGRGRTSSRFPWPISVGGPEGPRGALAEVRGFARRRPAAGSAARPTNTLRDAGPRRSGEIKPSRGSHHLGLCFRRPPSRSRCHHSPPLRPRVPPSARRHVVLDRIRGCVRLRGHRCRPGGAPGGATTQGCRPHRCVLLAASDSHRRRRRSFLLVARRPTPPSRSPSHPVL